MRDPSLTPAPISAIGHMITMNPNPDPTARIRKDLLYLGIKPAIHQQYLVIEKMVTQKLLLLLNTQTVNQEGIYEELRQDNLRLHNHVLDLTKELRSVIRARTLPTWTSTRTAPKTSTALHPRVTAAAVERQVP